MRYTIAHQPEFSYPAFKIINNRDYSDFRNLIERILEILNHSKLDLHFAEEFVNSTIEKLAESGIDRRISAKQIHRMTAMAIRAHRCTLAGILLGRSHREVSILIAESPLLQRFCTIARIENQIRVPTKSTLQRFAKMFDEDFIRKQVALLNRLASDAGNPLEFRDPFDTEDVFVDATCLKAKIHFPVDWILIKDCTHTILEAIIVIRKHGLKHRIKSPQKLISELNALCMSMTSLSRDRRTGRERKTVFRKLKRMAGIIRTHGVRYAELLIKNREKDTDLSEAEAGCILKRLEKMIRLLPEAVFQANSRIITKKMVDNQDKLLSVYHSNVNVIKRGKAGGQVEFGNTLFIAEQADGIILDWHLYRTDVKEPQATKESVRRMTEELEIDIFSLTGDRGCQSKQNDKFLTAKCIYNGLCPRNPLEYAEKLKDERFKKLQKRRAQTEGRIGIVKNVILDGSLYEREIEGKQLKVGWAILVHNLWCMARLPAIEKEKDKAA